MADYHLIRIEEKRSRGFRNKILLLALLPLAATGCAGQPTQMGTFAKNVPNEEAMVLPPPSGPAIVSVIERRYDNAVQQDISLYTSARTPGQNSLKVQLFGTESPFTFSENKLSSAGLTEASINSEMRQTFPSIRMARSSYYVQNNYGPFGYAFGHSGGGDLCMYAWQQLRSPGGTMSPFANFGAIQVRLRYCQADATEQQLLAVMYNYTITASVDAAGWNPYGEPQSVAPTLGATSAPIYPRPTSNETIVPVLPPKPAPVYVRPAVTRAARPVATAPVATAPPVFVPPPAVSASPTVSVPRPVTGQTTSGYATAPVGTPSGQAATRSPVVPTPSGLNQPRGQRVTVPSPACSQTSGAANACR
ncbi:cellulose biosynthesis protein BcsN [Rhizobium sp. XQZ8]|uniref:cellulose biosynthesis protein BcsN n=1 Tax=Rhizobium populisoli TaxID=2859785 RepID=UPI001CA5C69C|nr:cellulose biosynthesis protein BcsN [Rhizobium populisoli]MBW6420689.1 cellulose biosynthesis protein BcsN [Rhizobium populisoli]